MDIQTFSEKLRFTPPQHTLTYIGSNSQPQYLRCYAPIEVSVETDFQTTLCIEDGPIYEYVEEQVVNMTVTLYYDPPSNEGIQIKSKTYQIPSNRIGALVELLRNYPERIEKWCTENSNKI